MSHTDELEEYDAELELRLKREYADVFPLFRYCVLTQEATYLCNRFERDFMPQASYPFFHITMDDVWVWDKNRPTRIIPRVEIYTTQDVTVEILKADDQILHLRGGSLTDIDHMVVASVVPRLTTGYQSLAAKYLARGRAALVVGPGVRTGVALLIDNPHEVGPDRIANAAAAFRRHGGPCVVVDFGTATNFDVVSALGEYLGGAIAPGIETSVDALTSRAARLLKVDLVPPARAI